MAQTTATANILTPLHNNSNDSMTQSSWSFLSNDISQISDGKLSFRGFICVIIGLVSIGCEATIMSKIGNGNLCQILYDPEIFGGYLLALGIFVLFLHRHKVYTLTSVFILSFYEFINLIRIIVYCSIVIANWKTESSSSATTVCESTTIKALTITCLSCACLGLLLTFSFMSIISEECRLQGRRTSPQQQQQQQMTSVAYTNPVAIIPTY